MAATIPGTDMNVTPEIAAPIMAKATTGHGAWRLPVKNVLLSEPREAKYDTAISRAKYPTIVIMTITGSDITYWRLKLFGV